jgi:hypothetical protein
LVDNGVGGVRLPVGKPAGVCVLFGGCGVGDDGFVSGSQPSLQRLTKTPQQTPPAAEK